MGSLVIVVRHAGFEELSLEREGESNVCAFDGNGLLSAKKAIDFLHGLSRVILIVLDADGDVMDRQVG